MCLAAPGIQRIGLDVRKIELFVRKVCPKGHGTACPIMERAAPSVVAAAELDHAKPSATHPAAGRILETNGIGKAPSAWLSAGTWFFFAVRYAIFAGPSLGPQSGGM